MRTYRATAFYRLNGDLWPIGHGEYFECEARLRLFTLLLFRRYFGHPAAQHWCEEGFMAEAQDGTSDHGREVTVEQINRDMTPIALLPPHVEVAA